MSLVPAVADAGAVNDAVGVPRAIPLGVPRRIGRIPGATPLRAADVAPSPIVTQLKPQTASTPIGASSPSIIE